MLDAWREWKRQCTLDTCSRANAARLLQFGHSRFSLYVRRYCRVTSNRDAAALTPTDEVAWHRFEAHLTTADTRQGKRYKDWLFERARHASDPPLDVIQGGATLIMRDVVRRWLRDECDGGARVSLQQPIGPADGRPMALEDLLPDVTTPLDGTVLHEYAALSRNHALEFMASMSAREKQSLLARDLGLSFADPLVQKAVGLRTSTLHKVYKACMQRLANHLRDRYPDDDAESLLVLALLTHSGIRERIEAQRGTDKPLRRFWKVVDRRVPQPAG